MTPTLLGYARVSTTEQSADLQLNAGTPQDAFASGRITHYTDAALVKDIWSAVEQLGFTGGEVLEPGSGAGSSSDSRRSLHA